MYFLHLIGSYGLSYGFVQADGTYNRQRCWSTRGRLSLFTRGRNGTLIKFKDSDYVFNGTYFECKGFARCSDDIDTYYVSWSVDNLLNKGAPINGNAFPLTGFISPYHISLLDFGSNYHINITCKSPHTEEEISVSTSSFGECNKYLTCSIM